MSDRITAQEVAPATVAEHRARLKRASIGQHTLTYVDAGPRDGRVIVPVHGMPTNSWLWRKIIPPLANAGLRVIAPDMLGFGASDKPEDLNEYKLDKQANRIIALMDHLGIQQWTQIGHDLGGPWTCEVVDRATDRLQGLIILNTSAYRDGFKPPAMIKMMGGPIGPLMLNMMGSRVTGPLMMTGFFKMFVGHAQVIDRAAVEGYWLPLHEGTTRPFRQFTSNFPQMFAQFDRYQAALRRLNKPALIMWGKKDAVLDHVKLPAQFARDLRVPPERVIVFDDANHFLQEDKAGPIAANIVKFLKEN